MAKGANLTFALAIERSVVEVPGYRSKALRIGSKLCLVCQVLLNRTPSPVSVVSKELDQTVVFTINDYRTDPFRLVWYSFEEVSDLVVKDFLVRLVEERSRLRLKAGGVVLEKLHSLLFVKGGLLAV